MSEKRVVVVIVEGVSDEIAIGGSLKEYFSSEEVQFAVVHGDITSDYMTTADNVISKVCDLVQSVMDKYGYKWSDFTKIIHIADTDGVFTKDSIQQVDSEGIHYFEDRIECTDKEAVEKRNRHKSEIMFKLYSTGKIHDIWYRLFFNSCNLEHVLYGELRDFSDVDKEILSDDFSERYEGKLQEFIAYISDKAIAVDGTYKETWKFIEKDKNSLHRHSNMHLIFKM